MTTSIFDQNGPHPEPSDLTAFAQNDLDRRAEHRGETCLADAFKAEGSHAFAFAGDKIILKHDRQVLDPLFAPYELKALDPDPDNAVVLGYKANGEPRIAVPVGIDPDNLPELYKAAGARSIYRDGLMHEDVVGEIGQGFSFMHWMSRNRFCGRCGQPTEPQIGGYRRACTACDNVIFPRTDPVAIMLVIDEASDRCLLGRGPHFAAGMYSCLAGFIEPGETIENAVRRETLEESGVKVGTVRYHASQPWPMPHSLMIGCYGRAESVEIDFDTDELEDCRWFSRTETAEMLDRAIGEGQAAPPRGAIAHRLMRDWLEWD
ncbi:NAD(+) diphosphatase [Rhizobium halophytocola]|uniref:NAD(+) diphosphatase n=1 Tax=Rhizobium halophytocola TaxID=735519 RepID=A0ABS4E177_9HYPH|nr:NAD(+) diphosphatase [Rhizobium halophytocola]MBP1851659.1 NAD+ diphosphatase [Rhizobium halophytocola]